MSPISRRLLICTIIIPLISIPVATRYAVQHHTDKSIELRDNDRIEDLRHVALGLSSVARSDWQQMLSVVFAEEIASQKVKSISVLAANGTLEFSVLDGAEIASVKALNLNSATPKFFTDVQQNKGLLSPIYLDDQIAAWISVVYDAQLKPTGSAFIIILGVGLTVFTLTLGVLAVFLITRQLRMRLSHMIDVTEKYRSGSKDARVNMTGPDELGQLSRAIDELSDTVNERESELFHQREHLEEVVLERTRDLVKEVRERQTAEDQVRQVVSSASEGIITADPNGIITSYNPAAEKMFGYTEKEAIGQNLKILMPDYIAREHDGYLSRYLKSGEPNVIGLGSMEIVAKRKNGQVFNMEIAISELKEKERHFFTGILRDITERKEAELKLRDTLETLQRTQDELVQSEKMASLGGLVAGVAHEINTPIGVGVTAASHLSEKATELEKRYEDGKLSKRDFTSFISSATKSSQIIFSNLNRASDLIKSFKQVAVDQSSEEPRQFNLLRYIEEVLISLHPKLKRTQHKVSLDGNWDLEIESYPGPIAQIVTNLVMNSLLHAYQETEAGNIKIKANADDESVYLTYEDDGCGMDETTASKVFDPFYTTKRGTGGSGLGMHILYNQVTQKLGGNVKCVSDLGRGTRFEFTFPLRKGSKA